MAHLDAEGYNGTGVAESRNKRIPEGAQFLHSYWLLHFEAAPFEGTSVIQLWAWVPIAPYASELILEFKNHPKDSQRILLDTFPIVLSSHQSEGGSLLEIYCLLMYWMEVVPILLVEKPVSSEVPEAVLWECSTAQGKRDVVLLFASLSYAQPPLFHLPYVEEPFISNVEQLILSQNHQEMDLEQAPLPMEKLCHLQDQKVNLHRASWGQCIVAPKTFSFPYCRGICLALNSELLHSNFEYYKPRVCSISSGSCVTIIVNSNHIIIIFIIITTIVLT
ncbi:hypothetical protein STEG23_006784, partial [Scotinomys teguina]